MFALYLVGICGPDCKFCSPLLPYAQCIAVVTDHLLRLLLAGNGSGVFGYPNVLGMYAFGLEETGTYTSAEEQAQHALDLKGDDMWAMHALSHVYEMQVKTNHLSLSLKSACQSNCSCLGARMGRHHVCAVGQPFV